MCELFAFRGDRALKQAPESFVAELASRSVACHLENLDDGLWLVLDGNSIDASMTVDADGTANSLMIQIADESPAEPDALITALKELDWEFAEEDEFA